MTPPADWRQRLSRVVGPIGTVRSLGGAATMVEAAGRRYVVKLGTGARDEADGLRQLRDVSDGPPVPEVVLAENDLLVTAAVERAGRTPQHEEDLGRALARLHRRPLPHWGGGSSFVGDCAVDPAPRRDGAAFYGARVEELARRCGLEDAVAGVVRRLPELLPPGGPALLHGDLWWGNVLFGRDGRSWVIDPSVHGGHPEEDLAMLALFGPVPDRLLGAYAEVLPLHPGWEERVALFQLCPLLVHSVLFGGGYRADAREVARRFA
ncbi:MAG TPA: fructosamine kinase family protein [Acidimicrobiales bacterium]